MRRLALTLGVLGASALAACSPALGRRDPGFAHDRGAVVDWNPTRVDVGRVACAVEVGDDVVVFSDRGALAFTGGALAGSDASVRAWTACGPLPAPDGRGTWAAGVDSAGQLWRLKDRSRLERVGDRFALEGRRTRQLASVDRGAGADAVVLTDAGIAVVDGPRVITYPSRATAIAAGPRGVIAWADGEGVLRTAGDAASTRRYALAGVRDVAVDRRGVTWAARADGVYVEGEGGLALAYRATSGEIHGLVAAGDRVWFAEGAGVVAVDAGGRVHVVEGVAIDPAARLAPSPSGDVWVIGGGTLARVRAGSGAAPTADARWDAEVRPAFLRACVKCHQPGGPSGVDLSSASAWRANAKAVRARALVERTMPPRDQPPLSDAERAAIDGWLGR